MELIGKKNRRVMIGRSQQKDCQNILNFQLEQFAFSQPIYLKNTLESLSGMSLVAYQDKKVIGHILLVPLTSRRNIGLEEAILITGIWTLTDDVAELLIREALMNAWESGFHAMFSFENHPLLGKAGFESVTEHFFALDTSKYTVYGMELSWNGFKTIAKDLTIPKTYLPTIDKLDHFSNN